MRSTTLLTPGECFFLGWTSLAVKRWPPRVWMHPLGDDILRRGILFSLLALLLMALDTYAYKRAGIRTHAIYSGVVS
jgi:hypothetical protein